MKEFIVENGLVVKAVLGVATEHGFSGFRLVTHGKVQYEQFVVQDGIIVQRPAGTLLINDHEMAKSRLNAIQYNLYSTIMETYRHKTFTDYTEGFRRANVYYDDINEADEVNVSILDAINVIGSTNFDCYA